MKTIKVEYVSEWEWTKDDTGQVVTSAELDLSNGQVINRESSDMNVDGYIKEYIYVEEKQYKVKENNGDYSISMDDLHDIIWDLNSKK